MTNGRANGRLRQLRIAALADELDYSGEGPWAVSIRDEFTSQRQELLRMADFRPPDVTRQDLEDLDRMQHSQREYISALHALAVSALRRCSETNEPFTLLLRDFDAEAASVRTKKRIGWHRAEYQSAAIIRYLDSPQDKLRPLLEALGADHPVISLFNHESRPLAALAGFKGNEDNKGVYFLALWPSRWSSVVARLAEAATMIIALADELGPGLQFELQLLDQLAAHDRTVLVMTGEKREEFPTALWAPNLITEYKRRRSQRESLVNSPLLARFGRRTTLDQLQAIGLANLEALAAQPPFANLLPLIELVMPNAPIQDEARERTLNKALQEIGELRGREKGTDETGRLIELMVTVGEEYNELREYSKSAGWARQALDVLRVHALGAGPKAAVSLRLRDLLITALTNSRSWREARIELALQMENLRTASESGEYELELIEDEAAQRMWLHMARLRRESDVSVQNLETELQAWSNSRTKHQSR